MTNPINFNLPNLGSTGVIQNPGDLGGIAQAMSGLPAILQANQQMEAQRQRDAQNQMYMQAQMDQMRFNQNREQAATQLDHETNAAAGNLLTQLTTPQQTQVGGGIMPFAFDAPVGNGHAVAQTRGTQTLTGKQTVSDHCTVQAVQVFKQQTGLLKSTFFAGGVYLHKGLCSRQDGSESVHDWGLIMHPEKVSS
jgi:hypothetical protein